MVWLSLLWFDCPLQRIFILHVFRGNGEIFKPLAVAKIFSIHFTKHLIVPMALQWCKVYFVPNKYIINPSIIEDYCVSFSNFTLLSFVVKWKGCLRFSFFYSISSLPTTIFSFSWTLTQFMQCPSLTLKSKSLLLNKKYLLAHSFDS